MSDAETLVVVPFVVMEPIVLLEITRVPLLAAPMPNVVPPLPEVVTDTDPVPLPPLIVLPVAVPTLTAPDTI